jgi:hypothetical protein
MEEPNCMSPVLMAMKFGDVNDKESEVTKLLKMRECIIFRTCWNKKLNVIYHAS